MYSVSNEYLTAIANPLRTYKIKAQFNFKSAPQAVFDDSTITGEVKIESQMVSGSSSCGVIDIGAVVSATAELTVIDNGANLKKYSGASFTECVSLLLENGEYEDVPMGTFYCDTSKMSRDRSKITVFGYDAMTSFNFTISETQRNLLMDKTAWNAVKILVASAKCGFDQDLSEFPNSNLLLDFSSTQIETGWDGIMWIAQLMGCFARINRQNYLEFVPIKSTWGYFDDAHTSGRIVSVRTIQSRERYNTTFSDDRLHIAGVSMPDDNNNLITRGGGGAESDSNVIIALEKNPLIKNIYSLEDILDAILTQISTVHFYAFHTEIISDPALDAGDTVCLQGGRINGTNDNNDLIGFVTHNVWRYRGYHELINTGQTPDTLTDVSRDILNNGQPKPQSEKRMNAISGKTNELAASVGNIINIINGGLDRAKYLQTYDGSTLDTATVLRTHHCVRYSTNAGRVGFDFLENSNTGSDKLMLSGTMDYSRTTGMSIHSIDDIRFHLSAAPSSDKINFDVRGYCVKPNGFVATAELSCDGLWVSDSVDPGRWPRAVQLFYASYKNTTTEYKVEFVIANIRFTVEDDGIRIYNPQTSLHSEVGKQAFIPWGTAGSSSTTEQSEVRAAEQVQTMSAKGAASGNEPSYTYDDEGIHISYNGHTKVIPWDT